MEIGTGIALVGLLIALWSVIHSRRSNRLQREVAELQGAYRRSNLRVKAFRSSRELNRPGFTGDPIV